MRIVSLFGLGWLRCGVRFTDVIDMKSARIGCEDEVLRRKCM